MTVLSATNARWGFPRPVARSLRVTPLIRHRRNEGPMSRAIAFVLIAAICVNPIVTRRAPARQTEPESPAGPQLPESSRTPLLRKVESSINRGVKYLLARQNPDGSWGEVKAGTDV